MLTIYDIQIGKKYVVTYDGKSTTCTVLSMDNMGDCEIKYANGHKAIFHCSYLEEMN